MIFRAATIVLFYSVLALVAHAAGLARTEHFSVISPSLSTDEATDAYAKLVCNNAERYLEEISKEWYGRPVPKDMPRGVISVRFAKTDEGFTQGGDVGHKYHNIFLATSIEKAAGNTLKHEIFHYTSAVFHPEPNRVPEKLEERCAKVYNFPAHTDTPSALKRELREWENRK